MELLRLDLRLLRLRGRFTMFPFCFALLAACGGGGADSGSPTAASTGGISDTAAPTINIVQPTSAGSFTTSQGSLTLGGNATDDTEVVNVAWSNSNGGGGDKSFGNKSVSWSFDVTLTPGVNDLAVTAMDAAGHASTRTLKITYTIASNVAMLTWNPNSESDLAGYRVYYGTSPGVYQQARGAGIVVNGTAYTATGLTSGTRYYFTVTAFDSAGNESGYSGEVFKDIP